MTGWEPIVVKPLIILRQIKTVETERGCFAPPVRGRHPSAWGDVEDFEGIMAQKFVGVLFGAAHGQIVAEVQSPKTRSRRCCETMIFVLSSFIRLSEPISRGTVTEQRNSTTRLRVSCPTSRTSEHSSARGCDVRMFGCLPLEGLRHLPSARSIASGLDISHRGSRYSHASRLKGNAQHSSLTAATKSP